MGINNSYIQVSNFFLIPLQLPSVLAVVNHLAGHAAVDADVFACDKTSFVAAKKQHHVGNVHRVANSASRLLCSVWTVVNGVCGVNPARRNRIYPCFARQAYCQRMCKRSNASFGCCVTFGLWLAHAVARRRNIYNRCSLCQVFLKQFYQVEWCCNSHTQSVLKLFVAASVYTFHLRKSIVDNNVNIFVLAQHLFCKCTKESSNYFSLPLTLSRV